jgi:DNA-binding transcriptional MerR regulator
MALPEPRFTLPDIAAVTQIEYRTIHLWLRRGLIRASVAAATGSGTPNLFDHGDVLEARVLADLRRLGAEMSVLERTARALQDRPARITGRETLIINGSVEIVREEEVSAKLVNCSPSMVFPTSYAQQVVAAFTAR